MADYTIPNLDTVVVGVATTTTFQSRQISYITSPSDLVLHLDSSIKESYTDSAYNITWKDLTSNNLDFSLTGTYSYSDGDGSLVFSSPSGAARLVDSDSKISFSGDFAIEAWIYLTSTPSSVYPSAIISSWTNTGNENNSFILYVASNRTLYFGANVGALSMSHPTAITLNEWHHVVVSRVSNTVDLYIDSVAATSSSYSSAITPTLNILIGTYTSGLGAGYCFDGKIPLIRVYKDRGLTAAEVASNYQAVNFNTSNGTVSIGNEPGSSFEITSTTQPGWFGGRRPQTGQVFPRYNK